MHSAHGMLIYFSFHDLSLIYWNVGSLHKISFSFYTSNLTYSFSCEHCCCMTPCIFLFILLVKNIIDPCSEWGNEEQRNKEKTVRNRSDSSQMFRYRQSPSVQSLNLCLSNNCADCFASLRRYPAIKASPPYDLSNQLSSISELCKFTLSLSSKYKQITAW